MRLRLITVPFCWLHEKKSLLFYFPLKLEHLWSGMVANQHIQFMFWSQSGLSGTNTISNETHKKTGKRQLPHAAYFHSYKWSCKDKQNSLPSQVVGIWRKRWPACSTAAPMSIGSVESALWNRYNRCVASSVWTEATYVCCIISARTPTSSAVWLS